MTANPDGAFMRALKHIFADLTERERYEDLYCALCNIDWVHPSTGQRWSCSWRYAGTVAAVLRGMGEDYLDYYAMGGEGTVAPWLREAMAAYGWVPEAEFTAQP